MAEYGRCLKLLWSTWSKTFETAARINPSQIRRNHLKQLEANYRRFQKEVELTYQPHQQIDEGLLRYYHNLAERQHRCILHHNFSLNQQLLKRINPYPRREANLAVNRSRRQKMDLGSFIE